MSTNQHPPTHETTVRVTYRDTDQMGWVYYGNYPTWFEVGRTELLRNTGSTYKDWEKSHGVFLPVVECHLNYHAPARYDDLLIIKATISAITKASITFNYEIRNSATDQRLVTGYTKHPFLDINGHIRRVAHELIPEWYALMNGKKK